MAKKSPPRTPLVLSPEALFRYQIVAAVKARELAGLGIDAAVREVAALPQLTLAGEQKMAAVRSIYRWLAEFSRDGPSGIETARSERTISLALAAPLLAFLRAEKAEDRYASVPELIRRARERGVIGPHDRADRTSVWRACARLGLPLRRVPAKHEADKRRFAYPHRMMMVLADGEFFRAGARRRKRVAVFFLDDASRFALGVVVGTAESAELFLRGLHRVLRYALPGTTRGRAGAAQRKRRGNGESPSLTVLATPSTTALTLSGVLPGRLTKLRSVTPLTIREQRW